VPAPHFDRTSGDARRGSAHPSSPPSPRDDSFGAGIF
jgi:hypothetical protein